MRFHSPSPPLHFSPNDTGRRSYNRDGYDGGRYSYDDRSAGAWKGGGGFGGDDRGPMPGMRINTRVPTTMLMGFRLLSMFRPHTRLAQCLHAHCTCTLLISIFCSYPSMLLLISLPAYPSHHLTLNTGDRAMESSQWRSMGGGGYGGGNRGYDNRGPGGHDSRGPRSGYGGGGYDRGGDGGRDW